MSGEPKRKRRRTRLHEFVDTEAVDNRTNEEEEDEEDDMSDFISSNFSENVSKEEAEESRKFYLEQLGTSQADRSSEFLKNLESRYVSSGDGAEEDIDLDDEEDFDAKGARVRTHQRRFKGKDKTFLVPTRSDPKLFYVRVKPGKEKEIVLTLLQKYFDLRKPVVGKGDKNKRQESLHVLSAFSPDNAPGFVYIEAFREAHVRQAIDGIDWIFLQRGVKLVPLDQMTGVVDFRPRGVAIKKGIWVRLRRGIYKGDLAYVCATNEARGDCMVKLIPRLGSKSALGGKRPEQKKFNEGDFAGGEISKKNDSHLGIQFTLFEGKKFFEGFLYKDVSFKSLQTQDVRPTLNELQLFGEVEDRKALKEARGKKLFRKGEWISVVSGPLKGIVGMILSINEGEGTCRIRPKHAVLKDDFDIELKFVERYIAKGDIIRVIGGEHKGESGTVTKIDGGNIFFYSVLRKEEFSVPRIHVEKGGEFMTQNSYREYKLHDLVKMGNSDWGAITGISHDLFEVIGINGTKHSINYSELKGKRRTSQINCRDYRGRKISPGIRVSVIGGSYDGRSGIVKHAVGGKLFILSNEGEIIVVSGREVEVKGSVHSTRYSVMGAVMNNAGRTAGRGRGLRHEMVGSTVRVKQGPYKGCVGIVKSVLMKTKARVELHSKMKIISIDLKKLKTIESSTPKDRLNRERNVGNMTTPFRDISYNTPMQPKTPHTVSGGMSTPFRAPRTPGQSEVWSVNLSMPQTPGRVGDDRSDSDIIPTPSMRGRSNSINTPMTNTINTPMTNTINTPMTNSINTPMTNTINTPMTSINTPMTSINTPMTSINTPMTSINTPMTSINTPMTNIPRGMSTHGMPTNMSINTPGMMMTNVNTPMSIQTPMNINTPMTMGGRSSMNTANNNMRNSNMMMNKQTQPPPEPPQNEEGWREGMMVEIGGRYNCRGTIKRVGDGSVSIEREDEKGQTIQVLTNLLSPLAPKKGDAVMFVSGENAGKIGKVSVIDDGECVIQMKGKIVPEIVDIEEVTRYSEV